MKRAARALAGAVLVVGCAGPPWFMGQPQPVRDGLETHAALPSDAQTPVPSSLRARIARARAACEPAEELAALLALERRAQPAADERGRLAALLGDRAAALAAFGRAAPAARDRAHARRLANQAPASAACAGGRGFLATAAVTPRLVRSLAAGTFDADAAGLSSEHLRALAELVVAEDPDGPDALFAAAELAARADRAAWAERLITDAVFASSDRLGALARGARTWQRLGDDRRACRRWLEHARFAANADDVGWDRVVGCAARDPAVGDVEALRRYVLDGTAPAARAAREQRLAEAISGAVPRTDAAVP